MIGRRNWMGMVLAGVLAPGMAGASGRGFGGLDGAFARIEAEVGGRLGVAVLDTGGGHHAGHRADERFPLTSTFKLLAAAATLARVDAGEERLDRQIRYGREKLVTYSPATEPNAGAGMTVAALCEATVTLSDNTAGNLLLEGLGGPAGLTRWLRSIGDDTTRLDRWETALNEAKPGDPRDTTTPAAMLGNLQLLLLGEVLSAGSRAQLTQWLRDNKTGDARLRAGLPQGWAAGEKTGSGGQGSTNDVGLFWPPGGAAPVLVAAYLTGSTAPLAAREAALAGVARAITAAMG